jgi:hypothetical protein
MKLDVMLAALAVGLVIYFMQWSFTFGRTSKIHLPEDQSRRWFFDRANELHPNLLRTVSSLTAFLGTAFYGHELQIWIAAATIFAPAFAIYAFTCFRSYYLAISDKIKYFDD